MYLPWGQYGQIATIWLKSELWRTDSQVRLTQALVFNSKAFLKLSSYRKGEILSRGNNQDNDRERKTHLKITYLV